MVEKWHGYDNGRIKIDAGIYAEYTSNYKLWEALAGYATEKGIGMQLHLAQTQGEVVDATYLQVGDKITLRYHPPVGSESYELFSWQVLEGDGNVWIDGSGKTCEVRALDAGSAVIRVTYEYTVEGYDVLTGYPENQPKSATQDYYFIIE